MEETTTTEFNKEDLKVGDIVFVVSESSERIVPILISEEITHKTIDGDSRVLIATIGPPDKNKTVKLSEIEGKFHKTIEDVEKYLQMKLGAWLEEQINSTMESAQTWYAKKK